MLFLFRQILTISFFCLFLAECGSPLDDLEKEVAKVPNPRKERLSWVQDSAGVLNNAVEINMIITQNEIISGTEIAVVILPSIGKIIPKDFAVALFKAWGIGKKGKDNGILVLHIIDQRRIEIEIGYGLEGDLPDAIVKRIIDNYAIPAFKVGNFSRGHHDTVLALVRRMENPTALVEDLLNDESSNAFSQSGTSIFPSDLPTENLTADKAISEVANQEEYIPDPTLREFYRDYKGKPYSQLNDEEKANLSAAIGRAEFDSSFSLTDEEKSLSEEYNKEQKTSRFRTSVIWHSSIAFLLLGVLLLIKRVFDSKANAFNDPHKKYAFYLKSFSFIYYATFIIGAIALTVFIQGFILGTPEATYVAPPFLLSIAFIFWSETFSKGKISFLQKRLQVIRDEPRSCSTCQKPMRKLSENEDDEFLKKGEIAEEYLKSVDYDVFVCPESHSLILKYVNIDPEFEYNGTSFIKIARCLKCDSRTSKVTSSKIIRDADYDSSGSVEVNRSCQNCGHITSDRLTIPQLQRSSSDSSSGGGSSSSSSSSGSFGGGSSGGGGAGGSY
jgi:uncharacterized protein